MPSQVSELESRRTVGKMFPAARLKRLKASARVRSMTPADFRDMEKAFGTRPQKVPNKKVSSLTTQDLVTLESLFSDYRMEIIANFRGVSTIDILGGILQKGDSCCCCCTPCCCCCAATQTEPFNE